MVIGEIGAVVLIYSIQGHYKIYPIQRGKSRYP
jgi:hypothetical protein